MGGLPECGVYSVEGLTALGGSGEGAASAPPKGEGQGGSICRFHNYDLTGGCRRNRDPTQFCPFDHVHCHFCRRAGHRALECDRFLGTLSPDEAERIARAIRDENATPVL